MSKSTRIPEQMQAKFDSIRNLTSAFCKEYLNNEYDEFIASMIATLCRKRPSPLLKGNDKSWAAGLVHAIGTVNFLFDKSETPHCSASDIYTYFGVGNSTGQGKSKEIRDMLKMNYLSHEWTLPSRMGSNSMIWMISVNGLIVDIRYMPLEVQEIAYAKGLIPYVPGEK
jgi:hypothetical protein